MATAEIDMSSWDRLKSDIENEVKRQETEMLDSMGKTIRAWARSMPTRKPGLLPTKCAGNTHVFARYAGRCMCGLVGAD